MIFTQVPAPDGQRLAVERLGFLIVASGLQQKPASVERLGHLGVVAAQELTAHPERVQKKRVGCCVVSLLGPQLGQMVEALGHLRMLLPQQLAPGFQSRFQQRSCALQQTEVLEDQPDGLDQRGPDLGLLAQLRLKPPLGLLEDLAGADRFPGRFERVRDLEEVDQQRRDLLGPLMLFFGPLFLVQHLGALDSRDDAQAEAGEDEGAGCGDPDPVPADELAAAIGEGVQNS